MVEKGEADAMGKVSPNEKPLYAWSWHLQDYAVPMSEEERRAHIARVPEAIRDLREATRRNLEEAKRRDFRRTKITPYGDHGGPGSCPQHIV